MDVSSQPPLLVDTYGVSLLEITIAAVPEMRRKGVGAALLDELIVRCSGTYDALTLNVHLRNPAARLYQRKGFRATGQGRGALGIAMRKDLGYITLSPGSIWRSSHRVKAIGS